MLFQEDALIADNQELIAWLTKVEKLEQVDQARGLRLASANREAWLDIDKETLYEHQTNLEKRLAEAKQQHTTYEGRLSNENYVAKAPAHLIEETRKNLEEITAVIARLQDELTVLSQD